jgi:hypothetical protein
LTVDHHDENCVICRRDLGRGTEEVVAVPTTAGDLRAVVADARWRAGRRGRVVWLQESTTGWARVRGVVGPEADFVLANVVRMPLPPKARRKKTDAVDTARLQRGVPQRPAAAGAPAAGVVAAGPPGGGLAGGPGAAADAGHRPGRVAGGQPIGQPAAEQLSDAPEVGRPAGEGGAGHPGRGRELGPVVGAEVARRRPVRTQPPEPPRPTTMSFRATRFFTHPKKIPASPPPNWEDSSYRDPQ